MNQPDLRFSIDCNIQLSKHLGYSVTWVTVLIYYYRVHYASRIGDQKETMGLGKWVIG